MRPVGQPVRQFLKPTSGLCPSGRGRLHVVAYTGQRTSEVCCLKNMKRAHMCCAVWCLTGGEISRPSEDRMMPRNLVGRLGLESCEG